MMMYGLGIIRDVSPNDNNEIDSFGVFICDTAGSVSWKTKGGDIHTIANAQAGVFYPCGNGIAIMSTGTTATGIKVV